VVDKVKNLFAFIKITELKHYKFVQNDYFKTHFMACVAFPCESCWYPHQTPEHNYFNRLFYINEAKN